MTIEALIPGSIMDRIHIAIQKAPATREQLGALAICNDVTLGTALEAMVRDQYLKEDAGVYALVSAATSSMKWCPKCAFQKPHSKFGANRSTKDGFQNWCKDCTNSYSRSHNSKPPDSAIQGAPIERFQIKPRYGVDVEFYRGLFHVTQGKHTMVLDPLSGAQLARWMLSLAGQGADEA